MFLTIATTLQTAWRGWLARRHVERLMEEVGQSKLCLWRLRNYLLPRMACIPTTFVVEPVFTLGPHRLDSPAHVDRIQDFVRLEYLSSDGPLALAGGAPGPVPQPRGSQALWPLKGWFEFTATGREAVQVEAEGNWADWAGDASHGSWLEM